MASKQLLHELLMEEQEPFHLSTFISDRRSQLGKSSPAPPANCYGRTRKSVRISSKRLTGFPKSACLFAFQSSTDADKSPFHDFRSKSPIAGAADLLRIPPRTAEMLAAAAARIQKQQKSSRPVARVRIGGFGSCLLGSVLKVLGDRSESKKRVDENHVVGENERLDGSPEAQVSSCPVSPFIFSVQRSPSSSGRRTPELSSPVASPSRCRVEQEVKNCKMSENPDSMDGGIEEKEQCSPVSVLDAFFEEDANEDINAVETEDEHDYDPECSYANIQRVKEQLLDRLRRFEKLAELDPIELERNFVDDSDDELEDETVLSEEERWVEPPSMSKKQSMDRFLNEAFFLSSPRHSSRKLMICNESVSTERAFENNKVFWGRMGIGLDLSKEVNFDGGQEFDEEIGEIAQEVEERVFGQLVEDLLQEFCLE